MTDWDFSSWQSWPHPPSWVHLFVKTYFFLNGGCIFSYLEGAETSTVTLFVCVKKDSKANPKDRPARISKLQQTGTIHEEAGFARVYFRPISSFTGAFRVANSSLGGHCDRRHPGREEPLALLFGPGVLRILICVSFFISSSSYRGDLLRPRSPLTLSWQPVFPSANVKNGKLSGTVQRTVTLQH